MLHLTKKHEKASITNAEFELQILRYALRYPPRYPLRYDLLYDLRYALRYDLRYALGCLINIGESVWYRRFSQKKSHKEKAKKWPKFLAKKYRGIPFRFFF